MTKIKFYKMHGLGNDFVILHDVDASLLTAGFIKTISHRNNGIGFDQLLFLQTISVDQAHYKARIFNADGSEVMQCGNGMRCLGRYIGMQSPGTESARLEVGKSTMYLNNLQDEKVSVTMPRPNFDADNIPVKVANSDKAPIWVEIDGVKWPVWCVSLGNPHAVLLVNELDDLPLEAFGSAINNHPLFPEGVNLLLVKVCDKNTISLAIYERGAGPTLACGSGACAAVVCAINAQLLNDEAVVHCPGGILKVSWINKEQLILSGPAVHVFTGCLTVGKQECVHG